MVVAVGTRTTGSSSSDEDFSPEMWKGVTPSLPARKQSVHLRVDADVLDFFKSGGKGHLTRMNAVLRSYMEAHQGSE